MNLEQLIHTAIDAKVFPGCVVGYVDSGGRKIAPFGRHTYAENSPAVTENTVYDLASITKSIPTATLALQLLDENKIALDDAVTTHIPEYTNDATIRHLLTYTLGNTMPLSSLKDRTPEEICAAVCAEKCSPGTVFSYSNTPAFLLGVVIERILGMPLDIIARQRIFDPLAMASATFSPRGAVPTEEGIQDVVHDPCARVFTRAGKTVGHAGLFANARDLLTFLAHVLEKKDERLCTNQIAHLQASTALGFELDQPWMGNTRTRRTFGKTGFTGTCIVADFEKQKALVILSNRTFPKRPPNTRAINAFRSAIADIIFA